MDQAFDSMPLRRKLRARGVRASVPERRYKHRPQPTLPPASKRRYQVERHAWMDSYRALVVRYAGKADNYRGLLVFAIFLICMRVLLHW